MSKIGLLASTLGLAFALGACAEDLPPPAPPPFAGAPPGPPAELGELLPPPPASAAASAAPAPAPVPEPHAPSAQMTIEPPFRLDRRIFPKARADFLAELADREKWNKGGMGTLSAELPPVPGHPAPKVIIDVTHAGGPLTAAEIQRLLRAKFWIKVVECYGTAAWKDPKLRGVTSLTIAISSTGAISAARALKTTLAADEVAKCYAQKLRNVTLPKAKKRTSASVEIQVGPGDEPIAPPASLLVPGEGELSPEEMRAVVEAARPELTACYQRALEYAPELWGRLGIRFHVTEKGKIDEAFEAETQFPDERVTLCVLRAARKLTFPVPKGGDLRFIVPLRFSTAR